VVRKLEGQGIIARSLPGTDLTRIAVGCWNDRSDIDRLVTALSTL
jgi:selenocysteine lyase/cysteine desulfurase